MDYLLMNIKLTLETHKIFIKNIKTRTWDLLTVPENFYIKNANFEWNISNLVDVVTLFNRK